MKLLRFAVLCLAIGAEATKTSTHSVSNVTAPLVSATRARSHGAAFLNVDENWASTGPVVVPEAVPQDTCFRENVLLGVTLVMMLAGAVACLRAGKGSSCFYLAANISFGVFEVLLCRHLALEHHGLSFSAPLGAAIVETMKLTVTLILLTVNSGWGDFKQSSSYDALLLLIPASFYFVLNLSYYIVVSLVTVADYAISYQTRVIFVALLWTVLLQTSLSPARWIACFGVCFGNLCHHGSLGKMQMHTLPLVLGFSALGSSSNIVCEKVYKMGQKLEINVQNTFVYSYGLLFGVLFFCGSKYLRPEVDVTAGLTPLTFCLLFLRACQGLFVSRILKYVDSVGQTISAAMVGPMAIGLAAKYLGEPLGIQTMVGVSAAYASSALFAINPDIFSKQQLKEVA
eukprot:TRINITY_DN1224_c0_g1_i1.p1 TRINITY_DN1224_c0_g1~~TRINITY_DN1224_c0_g1_i1.p1  ORF type:complete len:400 (+),score=54.77 TRINITY_DN1224_c0_g1_i1:89-1288(+)